VHLLYLLECKRTLDQLVWLCALHPVGQSSNPLESGFVGRRRRNLLAHQKNPLVFPTPKHRSKASSVLQELRCHCVWLGQRFGGFLDLREKVFLLSTMSGGCLTPVGRVFLYLLEQTWCWPNIYAWLIRLLTKIRSSRGRD
jgi:hypothetical protein